MRKKKEEEDEKKNYTLNSFRTQPLYDLYIFMTHRNFMTKQGTM